MSQTAPHAIPEAMARGIVSRAIDRYVEGCERRIEPFVDANYSFLGSLKLHRRALGLDVLRAPANVALVVPYVGMQLGALGLRKGGAGKASEWIERQNPFFTTDVARELTWRLHTELLLLPYADGERTSTRDALTEEVMADPTVVDAVERIEEVIRDARERPEVEARFKTMLETYAGARNAAADLVNNAILAGAGAVVFQKLTPGTLTLGPVLAAAIAHQAAVASFPLGAGLGSIWYGWFPAAPSAGLVAGATGGLMLGAALLASFAGVISDPAQKALGLHQDRLRKLIQALGHELRGDAEAAFRVRDHYVARIFDLVDIARATYRSF